MIVTEGLAPITPSRGVAILQQFGSKRAGHPLVAHVTDRWIASLGLFDHDIKAWDGTVFTPPISQTTTAVKHVMVGSDNSTPQSEVPQQNGGWLYHRVGVTPTAGNLTESGHVDGG